MLSVKDKFPFFKEHPDLVYLDSAATTQKPREVIACLSAFYTKANANAGRSSYRLATGLAKEVERVRESVRAFIGASSRDEIVFTSGATDAFNKIAYSIALNKLQDGDEILYCSHDHKSFVLPWFQASQTLQKRGVHIHLIPFGVNKTGSIDRADLLSKVSPRTKVINVTHVHNVYGADSDIDLIKQELVGHNIILNVDATQSVGHRKVDVQELGADILSFSGHKMFASQGIGVLYVKKELHEGLPPVFVGGGNGAELQNGEVRIDTFAQSYEAGTQNFAGICSLGKAIEFIESIGIEEIHTHLRELTQYALMRLRTLKNIEFLYGPYYWSCVDGAGILSFRLQNIPSSEVGFITEQQNILVRTGDHCMSNHGSVDDSVRISMHIYNSKEDVDTLVNALAGLGR